MFKKITLKNEREFLLNTDDIAFVGEKHQEPTRLYDEIGNLVSEVAPTEKIFELVLVLKNNYHKVLVIGETTYNEIVNELVK